MDIMGIIQQIEIIGVPLLILIVLLIIIYKTLPKFLEEFKAMNKKSVEVIEKNTEVMIKLQLTLGVMSDTTKSSFERVHNRIDKIEAGVNLILQNMKIEIHETGTEKKKLKTGGV